MPDGINSVRRNKMKKTILLFSLLLTVTMGFATTIQVPGDYSSIQAAIYATVDGDTVLVQPGAYVEDINFNGKDITVASYYLTYEDYNYIEQTIILGSGNTSVVRFNSNETNAAKLIGFTVTGGSGYSNKGGGIYCNDGSPTLQNLIISGNHLTNSSSYQGGGGIYCGYSAAVISDVIIQDNSVNDIRYSSCGGGGIYLYNSDAISLTNVTVTDNEIISYNSSSDEDLYGGGIFVYSSDEVNMNNLTITGNSAEITYNYSSEHIYGAGLCLSSSVSTVLENSTIQNNSSTAISGTVYGGGVYCNGDYSLFTNNSIDNNTATGGGYIYGGGFYCDSDNATLENVSVTGNSIDTSNAVYGGGLYYIGNDGTLDNVTINSNEVTSNSGQIRGGGLYYGGANATLLNVFVENNVITTNSYIYGGGLYHSGNSGTWDNVTINNNTNTASSYIQGGGLYYSGNHGLLENLSIYANSAVSNNNYVSGGGYYCSANSLTLNNVTINSNFADANTDVKGGGLYFNNSSVTAEDMLVHDNEITTEQSQNAYGAGIYLTSGSYNYFYSEISNNYCASTVDNKYGGGIHLEEGTLALTNVTLTNNDETFTGSGIYSSGVLSLTNTIIWDNEITLETYVNNLTVSYCDIDGGLEGITNDDGASIYWLGENINANPLFADAENVDYHLTANSPCVDAGSIYSDYDIDGTIADIGAYFYDQTVDEEQPTITVSTPNMDAYPGNTVEYSITLSIPDTVTIYSIEAELPCFEYPVTESNLSISDELSTLGWLVEINDQNCPVLVWFAGAEGITGEVNILDGSLLIDSATEAAFVPLLVSTIRFNEIPYNVIYETGGINVFGFEPYHGDVNLDESVSVLDANFIHQYLLEEIELDAQQQFNAEVSGDLSVSSYDASFILQHVGGLIDEFPVTSGEGVLPALGETTMENMHVQAGDSISVPLNLVNGDDIYSFEFELLYDNLNLTFNGIEMGEGFDDFEVLHIQNEGVVKIVGASAYEVAQAGIFLNLSFVVPVTFDEFSTEITLSEMRFNENESISNVASSILTLVNYGDVSLNGTVSALDGSMILQYLLDEIELDEQQQLNAEVSGDETISAYDTSLILQWGVELIEFFPIETGAEIVIASGDISMEDMEIEAGTSISVPLYLENGADLFSFEFHLSFDNSILEFTGVGSGDNLNNFQIMHLQDENNIKIVGASAYEDGETGIFLELLFDVPADYNEENTEIALSEMRFNENESMSDVTSTILTYEPNNANENTLPNVTELTGNYPNPFNPTTTISFSLSEADAKNTEIAIFNIKGQLVDQLQAHNYELGMNQIVWNAANQASGVYFYKLVVDGKPIDTRRMILLK